MSRTWTTCLSLCVVAFSWPAYSQVQSTASTATTAQVVIALNRAMNEAAIRGDVKALDRYWASDAMWVGNDGRIWNKAERLEDFRSRNRAYANEREEEPRVQVHGELAILAYAGWLEGNRNGRPFESRSFLTRVFKRGGDGWQLVYQHSALLERRQ